MRKRLERPAGAGVVLVMVMALVLSTVLGCAAATDRDETKKSADPTAEAGVGKITVCADGSDALCSYVPRDVTDPGPGYQGLTATGQAHFDQFSWQMFVALNWPAGEDGDPSSSTIGTDPTAPRVWQYYTSAGDYFDPEGTTACPSHAAPVFSLDSKIDQVGRSAEFSEAFSAPLIDVNGNFAVFDVRMNDVWTEYVTNTKLRTYEDQQSFTGTVDFTEGCLESQANCPSGGQIGAIELKSSWMLVPEGQEQEYAADHYVVDGWVSLEGSETSTGEPACLERTLALTGMHVVVKTATDGAAWIWGTFEHEDTAPFATTPLQPIAANTDAIPSEPAVTTCTASPTPGSTFSFYDPSCTTSSGGPCPVNTEPKLPSGQSDYQWNLATPTQYASDYLVNGFGTQATRCWAVYEGTDATNEAWKKLLAGTVWANYRLMGTQWQTLTDAPPPAPTNRIPAYLANATMETYFQTTSSCLSCHEGATLAGNSKVSANFSWLLNREVLKPSTEEPEGAP